MKGVYMTDASSKNLQYYDLRAAEEILGIAKYTGNHLKKRHPLPKPAARVGKKPVWTVEQILEWYDTRPMHGGDRRSVGFKNRKKI